MKKETMSELLESLKRFREQALSIKLYSEETYEHFQKQIEGLEQALIAEDDDRDTNTLESLSLVDKVTRLEFDINHYMKTGRLNADAEIFWDKEGPVSGHEMEKQHRIDVYKNLVDILGKMKVVDVARLKKLKEQWDREKEGYSEVETNAVEKALADAYIEYQIKTCSIEGRFPEESMEEFCLPDVYESELKKKIVDHITTLPKDSPERFELEGYFLNWDLKSVLRSGAIWKALSGREPEIPLEQLLENFNKTLENMSALKPEEAKKENGNPNNLPLDLEAPTSGNAVLVVYEKKLPNGTVERKKKIKNLDEKGRFKLFFNKDQVVELYFLEGTTELNFTKNGNSRGTIDHLSSFPNLRNVYLPSTLRFVEQGYFQNCDNLENVFLAKGTYYKPNPQLFPEHTKVVENKEKSDRAIVITEPEEASALFTQVQPTGEKKTVKVHLKAASLLPKTFVRAGMVGLEEVHFTRGTNELCSGYWSSSYDSYYIHGGKFSDIQGLKRIVLPEKLHRLGESAFANCTSLEEVTMPEDMETIGYRTFENCVALRKVKFPQNLKTIEDGAFKECASLNNVVFPETLKDIKQRSFMGCESLEAISIPEGFQTISSEAFKNCYNLKSLKLPTLSMSSILGSAFENCARLTQVCFPQEMKEIRDDAFRHCSSLEQVLMPRSYKTIEKPFKDDTSIKYVVMPNSMPQDEATRIFDGIYYINFVGTPAIPAGTEPEEFLASQVNKVKIARQEEWAKQSDAAKKKKEEKQVDKTEDIEQ